MWNETVFPSISPPPPPPPGHSFGNRDAWLLQSTSNNASMELERLVNCGKFFNGLQDNYAGEFSFHRHVFSPSTPGRNCYIYGDEVKETAGCLVPVRRSQKLGDKITALQQLVSPFGKTDTASVLHEAALSIKFLHDQIEMLTTPCTGIGSSHCSHHQGHGESSSSSAGGLRERGLCLVPIYTILGLNLMKKEPTDDMSL
ncbi:hypothetical protein ZIOFF_052354 [Zingiber officinale]|uniref:BHLH domain-containing protein n=1 Tax=Zingiber officinale TaxID=94328 RepID=A0A8J5FK39_ZINOF|nr:hypothetical protein ZIOFF_052354 [Zingiber officinale]